MSPRRLPSAAPSDCERFAEAAMLRVDRELGPAESAALDAHLAVCAACRAKALQAEALSAVLKRWDNVVAARVDAPARLRQSLRAVAAEEGRWRRVEARRVRRLRLAVAASVLLALAAGLAAGLASVSGATYVTPVAVAPTPPRPVEPPAPAFVAHVTPPTVELGTVPPGPSRLRDVVVDLDPPAGWLSADEKVEAARVLARCETRRLLREAFERDYGEDAYWYTDQQSGEDRLITGSALAQLRAGGVGRLAALLPGVVDEARTVADPVRLVDTGRRFSDFLRLPTRRDEIEALVQRGIPIRAGKADAPPIGWVSLLPGDQAQEAKHALPQTVDLSYAVQKGYLELREAGNDDLVAVVHRASRPVFIPAGELISGGQVDRVVLEGILIPATTTARPIISIPCAAASSPGGSHGEQPTPTGMVAGPALRGVLARHPGAEKVRAWIASQVPILDKWGRDYSLLDHYDSTVQGANLTMLTSLFLSSGSRGFALTGARGEFVGVEVSDLPRESAAALLARLLWGYTAEADMKARRAQLHGDTPVERLAARPSVVALLDLIGSTASFRTRASHARGARVLRMIEPHTNAGLEVVESKPDDGAVLASALAP